MAKTWEEINARIASGSAVVLTAEEFAAAAADEGVSAAARRVDVVTTGTYGPMCSSGVMINFGHSDPPIKMGEITLNDVPASGGLAAVDTYLGVTEPSRTRGIEYGGAHVIEDLLRGRAVRLRATGPGTDCYPRTEIDTWVTLEDLNQAYFFNPRNAYQNYAVAVNTTDQALYTYLGTLLPRLGNATYCSAGALSPLLNDPTYRTIGVGTRCFVAGAPGYVAWEGTQHNPHPDRDENGVPVRPAGLGRAAGIGLGRAGPARRATGRQGAALAQRRLRFADHGAQIHQRLGPVAGPVVPHQPCRQRLELGFDGRQRRLHREQPREDGLPRR